MSDPITDKIAAPEEAPSQESIDRAVFEHNTEVARAQLKANADRATRAAIVPAKDAEKVKRGTKFNIEPAAAKALVDADMITGTPPQLAIAEGK